MRIEEATLKRIKEIALVSGASTLILFILEVLLAASMHSGVDPAVVFLFMILLWISLAAFVTSGIGFIALKLYDKFGGK